MKYEIIELKKYYNIKGGTLKVMCCDYPNDDKEKNWCRPAVIVVPGGGYHFCSKREQEPVAFEFLQKGYNVFVLDYLCAPDNVHFPEQLLELGCTVDFIKKNAKEYRINSKEIFAVGFSAGGHLVANLSTDYTIAQKEYSGKIDTKITAAGLIYPVISDEYGHCDSFDNLFSGTNKEDTHKARVDKLVGKNTTPAFIFSTFEDKTVPSMNALKYAEKLAENGIQYELHVYKNGGHGASVGNKEINKTVDGISRNTSWMKDCAAFFRDFTKEEF